MVMEVPDWAYLLWGGIVREKYKYGATFNATDIQIPAHGGPWKNICAAIMLHPRARQFIRAKVRKKVGSGAGTFFWHETWVGESPLKITCPRLFRLSTSPNATIDSCGYWDGVVWKWSLAWTRPLRLRDNIERENLSRILASVALSPQDHDSLIWTPHKSGNFPVKSLTHELAKLDVDQPQDIIKGIWRSLFPPQDRNLHMASAPWEN